MQPKKDGRLSGILNLFYKIFLDITASDEEIKKWAEYLPQINDWPVSNQDLIDASFTMSTNSNLFQKCDFYNERALKVISFLQNFGEAEPANKSLMENEAKELEIKLGYALDLQTISQRLINRFYRFDYFLNNIIYFRRAQSFFQDVDNFAKLFSDNSLFVFKANIIKEVIYSFMRLLFI